MVNVFGDEDVLIFSERVRREVVERVDDDDLRNYLISFLDTLRS